MTVSTRLPARRLLCMTVSTRLPARRLLRMACFILTRQQARRLFRIDPATSPAAALYRPCYRLCACFVSIRLPTRRLLCIDPATGPAPALYLPCYRDRPDTCSVIIIESVWPALYRPGYRPGPARQPLRTLTPVSDSVSELAARGSHGSVGKMDEKTIASV
jgi:hypothetical protein